MNSRNIAIILGLIALGGAVYYYTRKPKIMTLAPSGSGDIFTDASLTVKQFMNAGIRNNNPVNIEFNKANNWTGQTGQNGRWAVFSAPEYGFRAAGKLLDTYANKYGLNTIAAIFPRYAPKNENDTKAYINYVAKRTGILAFSPITRADYPKLLQAMAKFETGKEWPMELITKGLAIK